jgi:hypothetical protein
MVLPEIIFNNPVRSVAYGQLVIPNNFIWDCVLFNGHFQMGMLMIGLWMLNDLFNLLFWDDIREIRREIKEKINTLIFQHQK